MRLNKFLMIRGFFVMLVLYLVTSGAQVMARQVTEGDKVETDTAQQINSSIGSIGDTETTVTDAASDGSTDDATTLATAEDLVKASQVYKSASFYCILFVLVCILIGVIGKVLKVYELTREIQGKGEGIDWNKIQAGLFAVSLIVGFYATYWTYSTWGYVVTKESGTEHGIRYDLMMMITIAITTFVFIITQFLLFSFAFKYKSSEKRKAYFYPHNNAIEKLWTIIPALVLTALVVFGFFTWRTITNPSADDQKNALSVEVTGEQFKWNVRYAGADNQLGLRNYKLTTPTDRKSVV